MGFQCAFVGHKWKNHAIDSGFSTTFSDTGQTKHHVIVYSECERCGQRKFSSSLGKYETHNGIDVQKAKWLGGSTRMYTTKNSEISDWRYFHASGIDELMRRIREEPEMARLLKEQPTVEDAVDQLETVIKMCSNL